VLAPPVLPSIYGKRNKTTLKTLNAAGQILGGILAQWSETAATTLHFREGE
jgi:hypothetical protein